MVKESQKSNIDKEYSMEISANCDTHVRLFCRGMNTDSPKEYITLFSVQKENFAYIHDYIQPSASKDSCVKVNGKETPVFLLQINFFMYDNNPVQSHYKEQSVSLPLLSAYTSCSSSSPLCLREKRSFRHFA